MAAKTKAPEYSLVTRELRIQGMQPIRTQVVGELYEDGKPTGTVQFLGIMNGDDNHHDAAGKPHAGTWPADDIQSHWLARDRWPDMIATHEALQAVKS